MQISRLFMHSHRIYLAKTSSFLKSMVQLFLKVTCMRVIQKFILVDVFSGPVFGYSILSLDNFAAVSKNQ